ncbi:HAMP domain-containing protein [Halorubrum sp. CBA1125]|uniref:sensor histidine kinase n=1 Tax=Halorubrum sp. CBA1125 TaxID=2668072 RepID=UPI0012E76010|nr:HAMP domain-containing sensor histidine kinase [Halorubrum sp. CBA1125]MUW14353.1 HAMP domain-containing protein [Halorubrum sp. CBA1125]
MSIESYLPESVRSRYALKLLGVSLLIVLVITVLTTVTVFQVSDRVRDNQLHSVETNAELEARALGQWIDGKQQVVRTLSNHEGLTPVGGGSTQSTLATELGALSPETESLSVVERSPHTDSNGTTETVVASTDTRFVGQPLSVTDANWKPTVGFNFDGTDDVIISLVYTDGDDTFVALASPMPDGEHVLVAEYRTSVRAERFTSAMSDTDTLVLGGFTAYVLFDENESSGITPYEGDRANSTIGQRILRSDPTTEINGSVLTDTEVKGYSSVPGDKVDWVVVKEVPRSTALAVTDRVQRDLWLVVTVVVAGFLLIGVVIQRGPIRSIQRLSRQANAIAEGDLSVDIDRGNRIDEVGEVRAAFSNTKAYIETITEQAEALSNRAFDDEVLDAEIPGRVGESMAAMRRDLRQFITRLEVFNRVLRHNLRNQLDVINSHAEALDDTEHREAILAATETLATVGTRARRIDHILSKDRQPTPVDLADRIEAVLDDVETDDVTVTTSLPDDTAVVTDAETLTAVLRSPLENAVTYADSSVAVSVASTDAGCTIEIADDGPGIPAVELESLAAERETSLQHSRGLGLWELKWGVDKLDGDLSFATDGGTTVTIRLPDLDAA